jgi:hypothetical protein
MNRDIELASQVARIGDGPSRPRRRDLAAVLEGDLGGDVGRSARRTEPSISGA